MTKMLSNFGPGIRLQSHFSTTNPLFTILKPLKTSPFTITHLSKPQTLNLSMENNNQHNNKRPMCPTCSKPTSVCFCNRFKTPVLDNTIAVTLLQHRLEKKHPLNSAKIATLGLKNVNLVYVSDVVSCAHFELYFLDDPNLHLGHQDSVQNDKKIQSLNLYDVNHDLGHQDSVQNDKKIQPLSPADDINYNLGHQDLVQNDKKIQFLSLNDVNHQMGHQDLAQNDKKIQALSLADDMNDYLGHQDLVENDEKIQPLSLADDMNDYLGHQDLVKNDIKMQALSRRADISFTVERRGVMNQDFDKLLIDESMINGLRNGFVVKKIKKEIDGNNVVEFEIVVPPGSLLLFPSESSIGVEEVDFDVKNLIVLDGTWGKALRMYKENPWLRLLPHLKLDVSKLSLYAEVRRQPKAGYLSSIESIVYALKAIGGDDDHYGLDCLLDVFESMVVDQRRCMNERLKFESSTECI